MVSPLRGAFSGHSPMIAPSAQDPSAWQNPCFGTVLLAELRSRHSAVRVWALWDEHCSRYNLLLILALTSLDVSKVAPRPCYSPPQRAHAVSVQGVLEF